MEAHVIWIIIAGLIALYIMAMGSLFLLAFAGEQGFIGLAVFAACWIFMWPIMMGVTALAGIVITFKQLFN